MDADRYLPGAPSDLFRPRVILPSQHFDSPKKFTPEHRLPRERKHLSTLSLAILTAGALALWWLATPRSAWAFPSNAEMRAVGSAPVGIPVQKFINKPVLALAREMLLQQHLDVQVHRNQPVHRGIEMDLFAPGDFGVVMRYCW